MGPGTYLIWQSHRYSFWGNFGFWQFFLIAGGKMGPKMDQNDKLPGTSRFRLNT